jgi:hypothetical protein
MISAQEPRMPGPSNPRFHELPYLEEYLAEILRPRAERTLQAVQNALNESVWQHLVRLLAAEQSDATDATPAMIRELLEERLGLRIEVLLKASFGNKAGHADPDWSPPQVVVPAKSATGLPLANAVISGSTREPRR